MTRPPGHPERGIPLWRWVLRYALRRRSSLSILAVAMLAEAGTQALAPWPMKVLVDQVLYGLPSPAWLARFQAAVPGAASREGLLAWCVAATVILFAIVAIFGVAQAALGTTVGQRLSYDLAADVFAHVQRLSLRSHGRRSVGDLMRRITADCSAVATIIRDSALPAAAAGLTLIVVVAVMLSLSVPLALLALLAVPALAIVVYRCTPPILDRGYDYAQAESEIWDIVEQTLTAVPAIQAFSADTEADRRVAAAYDGVLASAIALTRAQFRLKVLSGAVTAALGAAMLWVGTREALRGSITIGGLILFLSYLAMLYLPLDAISHAMGSATQAAGAARRVLEILDEEDEVKDHPGARPLALAGGPTLALRSVTFGYAPDRPAIEEVSFEIPAGATVALVGPSGAGKSTIAALLPRLFDPWRGEVLLNGRDLRDFTLRTLRSRIAMVLQETFLFPVSVAGNIAYGRPDASRSQIVDAAQAAGAREFISALPHGYDTVLGQRGATLSGGERQRLAIARALLMDSPILVLDEPTSALDSATEAGILAALDHLRSGRTTLLIAHRLSTIRNADLIVVMDRGRVVETGSHAELLRRGGLFAHLYHLQNAAPPGAQRA